MKKLLVLIALAGGIYLYFNNQAVDVNIDSYGALLSKVEKEPVTVAEVKAGANLLTTFLCNDVSFQTTGVSTVKACTDKHLSLKSKCEEQVFSNVDYEITRKSEVTSLVKRFISCAGVS